MAKNEKKAEKSPTAVSIVATRDKTKNYFAFRLPQRESKDAPAPDETGSVLLGKEKYPEWANAKGAKVTIEPIF